MKIGRYCLIALLIIAIVLLILHHRKMNKFVYLNTNSTDAIGNGYFNPSDLGYTNMAIVRQQKEQLKNEIKHLVNAPVNAKVIFNSGATESIATCINWAKSRNHYGSIVGTSFDHSAVQNNCQNQDVPYAYVDGRYKGRMLKKLKDTPNTSAIFLTHVNSKTGEILPQEVVEYGSLARYMNDEDVHDLDESKVSGTYRPLIFMDATQSITKLPIDMEKWRLNAVFFSLHKIGGPMNMGVLVINDEDHSFKPLIAGEQNDGLRGGTFNDVELIKHRDIFKPCKTTIEQRQETWEHAVKQLKGKGLDIYEPTGDHLYNTILINISPKVCPLSIVNKLSEEGIYLGTSSACANEKVLKGQMSGGDLAHIRLSFINPDDLTDHVLNEIGDVIKTYGM